MVGLLLIVVPSSIVYVSPIHVAPIFIIISSIIVIPPIVRIFRMNAHVFRRLITGNTIRFVIGDCVPQVIDVEKWVFIRGIAAISITSTIGVDIPIIKVNR